MNVDFLTLACLKQELERLQNAKIQQVQFTNERALALELYAGFRITLLLDVNQQHSRALLQQEKARRGIETETPLLLLLRKYVRGGRLRRVEQPLGERILRFHIESKVGRTTLVAEIMGRYSNLLLLNEHNVILECVRRVRAQQNRYRVTLPNKPYQPPPPLRKKVPTELEAADWRMMLAAASPTQPLERFLIRELAAVSPTLAREIVARISCPAGATGKDRATVRDVDATSLQKVVDELFAPVKTKQWLPSIARDEDGEVIAFAPYHLTQFERVEPVESISEAMQRYFAVKMASDAYAAARSRCGEILAQARKAVKSRLYQLRKQTIEPAELEKLRETGELLLAYQWQVPKAAKEVELFDFEGNPRRISLDPTLSAVKNAQKYFTRYNKKKRAAKGVPPLIDAAEQDARFLEELANDLAQAEDRPEIEAVRELLEGAGFIKKKRRPTSGGIVRGPRRVLLGDWVALVGRNAKQNDEVTFRHGKADDLWFHARHVPGSHVILKSAGRDIPEEIIKRAASLAAYYSKAGNNTYVDVSVTQRRHVRRVSGGRPGLVTLRNEQTVRVKPMSVEEVEEMDEE